MNFLAFGGLGKGISRRISKRPAVSPAVRPISMPAASAKVAEVMPARVKVEQKRKVASATQRKIMPTEVPKRRSGARVGGKTNTTKPTTVENDTSIPMGPVFLRGPQRSTVISHTEYDAASPPPPIEVEYEVGQVGSSKSLDEYKKMYKGSTYELPTATLIAGDGAADPEAKRRPSTMAGFGRKNVAWPYWLHDYYSSADTALTSRTSCFNRYQFENLWIRMWKDAVNITDQQAAELLSELELAAGGDQRVMFPLDYIECEYKYFNNNIAIPIDLSLYICMPTRNMTGSHSPMYDWFDPGDGKSRSENNELMSIDYFYEPVLTAGANVMFTNPNGTPQNIDFLTKKESILTASTEVVPEATPQGFSSKFRRNWDVKHVQHFVLMPQQELVVKFKVKFSKLLDIKQFFAYDSMGDKFELFKDLTMFPMVTFQGQDTTGVSKKLDNANSGINRFLDTTAPRSGASMLSSSMKTRARVHTKSAPTRPIAGGPNPVYTIQDMLDVVSVSKRDLFSYRDRERGQQCPYYQVSDNLGYFIDEVYPPGSTNYLTQLVQLNLKANGQTLPNGANPPANLLTTINTQDDWGVVVTKTTSKAKLETTASDVSKL